MPNFNEGDRVAYSREYVTRGGIHRPLEHLQTWRGTVICTEQYLGAHVEVAWDGHANSVTYASNLQTEESADYNAE